MAAPTSNRPDSGTRPQRAAAQAGDQCAYCGEALTGRRPTQRFVDGRTRTFCCLGCAFIAEQLGSMARGPDCADDPRVAQALPPATTAASIARIDIGGMVCAACAVLLESRLRAAPGVRSAHVDFVAQRAQVLYDAQQSSRSTLMRTIEQAGYRVLPADDTGGRARGARMELLRMLLAWLAMMQVMMLAAPAYLAAPGQIPAGILQLLRVAQCVLSIPVVAFCAAPFWRAAFSQLRVGQVGMDVPVALGIAAATAASAWSTLGGQGAVYFDSVTMFVALLLSVRWWQIRAMASATAQVDAAARQSRFTANRLRRNSTGADYDTIAAEALRAGDLILVPTGEVVTADATITQGATSVSQAWLTGESTPLAKSEGDMVLAGSLNVGQPIVATVVRAGDATSLAVLQQLIVAASARRPQGATLASRIAGRFSLAVLALAGLTLALWLLIDPARAAAAAIAVLVVTCPCALSLAAPLATAMAQARLARSGILVLRASALESLARVDTVALDKTGTLTEHDPRLERLEVMSRMPPDDCLAIAASIDAHSHHPFAQALNAAAHASGIATVAAICIAEHAGDGIEGVVAGQRFRLGRPGYALGLVSDPAVGGAALATLRNAACGVAGSQVVLAGSNGPLAVFTFSESLRRDAVELLDALERDGRRVLILSGDQASAVGRVARELRDATTEKTAVTTAVTTAGPKDEPSARPPAEAIEWHAEQSPEGKRAIIETLQRQGHRVAMVGDGMNDAPVIAQADASIALASGSRLAQVRADVIIPDSRLIHVQRVFALSQRTAAIMRQNLWWALAYNIVMVPLAALGLLAPWIAAGGMAMSAALVLVNSLRLRGAARPLP